MEDFNLVEGRNYEFADHDIVDIVEGRSEKETETEYTPVIIQVANETITIQDDILKSTKFKHSRLPQLLSGNAEVPPSTTAEDLKLLFSHIRGGEPLIDASFREVIQKYEQLLSQVIFWGISRSCLALPTRLWTDFSWTDLKAFYSLDKRDHEILKTKLVGKHLNQGSNSHIVPAHVLQKLDEASRQVLLEQVDISELTNVCIKKIHSWKWNNNVILNYENNLYIIDCDSKNNRNVLVYCLGNSGYSVDASEAEFEPHACQIRSDSETNVIHYYLSSKCAIGVLYRMNIAMRAWRIDRLSIIENERTPEASPFMGQPSWMRFLGSGASLSFEEWRCTHPDIKPDVHYSSTQSSSWFNGPAISRVQFYRWGALFMPRKVNCSLGPIAVISVDDADLSKIYPHKIVVHVRFGIKTGVAHSIDITVDQSLAKVYVCIDGSLLSQCINPLEKRIFFELPYNDQKVLKNGTIEIAEGCPKSLSAGKLRCLGILGEFDCANEVYYQASISQRLCHTFTKLHASAKSMLSTEDS